MGNLFKDEEYLRNLDFRKDKNGYTCILKVDPLDSTIYIPAFFNDTPVVNIKEYFAPKIKISIVIEDGMTKIGAGTFCGCSSLTSIIIPNSVTKIGKSAFAGCSSLTSITIPNSVTEIGKIVFASCSSLTSITIPNGVTEIGESAFENCSSLTSIIIPNSVTEIGKSAFASCSSLTSITIPDGVTKIGNFAFSGCSSLTSIIIPNGVTEIGWGAFSGCSSLTSIIIPNGVTKIGESAFEGCSSLTSIIIPNGVTEIWNSAFEGCVSLASITISNSLKIIGSWVFNDCFSLKKIYSNSEIIDQLFACIKDFDIQEINCNDDNSIREYLVIRNFEVVHKNDFVIGIYENKKEILFRYIGKSLEITIPNGVTEIGESAFENCSSLTSIIIPNSVTEIGKSAFASCSSLTSITIPDGVTKIGNFAFSGCSSLTSIIIPNGVTEIGKSAFAGCSSLTSIIIPNGVTKIGESAFSGCSSLTSITIPNGVTEIGWGAFSGCSSLTSIIIPDSITKIWESAFNGCSSLTSIIIPNGVTEIEWGAFLGCGSLTSITISNNVTKIWESAFSGCSSLTSIIIPNGVTEIGENTFSGCSSLTSIIIPNGVTKIGKSAFAGCSSLTSIIIPNGVTEIEWDVFKGCSSLASIIIPNGVTKIGDFAFEGCSSLTSIIIPNGVTKIGKSAFAYCSFLTSITIPNGVTEIGEKTFKGCSSLTSVTIPNSLKIIGSWAFDVRDSLEILKIMGKYKNELKIDLSCFSNLKKIYISRSYKWIDDLLNRGLIVEYLDDDDDDDKLITEIKNEKVNDGKINIEIKLSKIVRKLIVPEVDATFIEPISTLPQQSLLEQMLSLDLDEVNDSLIERAKEVFENNSFTDIKKDENVISAKYQGTGKRKYNIKISLDDYGEVIYHCSCPSFKYGSEPCKHIYGLIMKLQSGDSDEEETKVDYTVVQKKNEEKSEIKVINSLTDEFKSAIINFSFDQWEANERVIKRAKIIAEGDDFFDIEVDGNRISAKYQGTEYDPYDVVITLQDNQIIGCDCSCISFELQDQGLCCKHTIALVLYFKKELEKQNIGISNKEITVNVIEETNENEGIETIEEETNDIETQTAESNQTEFKYPKNIDYEIFNFRKLPSDKYVCIYVPCRVKGIFDLIIPHQFEGLDVIRVGEYRDYYVGTIKDNEPFIINDLYIHEKVEEFMPSFLQNSKILGRIYMEKDNPYFYYSKDRNAIISSDKTLTIAFDKTIVEDDVLKIGDYAFAYCKNIEEVILPENIEELGSNPFYLCPDLKTIVLSKNIKRVKDNCIYGCEKLETVIMPEGLKKLVSISSCKMLKQIIIPNSISHFRNLAFAGSNIEELYFSYTKAIKNIDFLYFSKIKEINFNGNIKQWFDLQKKSSYLIYDFDLIYFLKQMEDDDINSYEVIPPIIRAAYFILQKYSDDFEENDAIRESFDDELIYFNENEINSSLFLHDSMNVIRFKISVNDDGGVKIECDFDKNGDSVTKRLFTNKIMMILKKYYKSMNISQLIEKDTKEYYLIKEEVETNDDDNELLTSSTPTIKEKKNPTPLITQDSRTTQIENNEGYNNSNTKSKGNNAVIAILVVVFLIFLLTMCR